MSHAGSTVLLVLLMGGMAVYFLLAPPAGFEDDVLHRLTIPFLLVACALTILENLRTRTHIAQLVGAIRSMMGRSGVPPSPEVKREAVEILLRSLRSEKESVRKTAAAQLRQLTGEGLGDSAEEWEAWWAANKAHFGKPQA